jgi:uncharacterized coiled-coil DUF342 family protein
VRPTAAEALSTALQTNVLPERSDVGAEVHGADALETHEPIARAGLPTMEALAPTVEALESAPPQPSTTSPAQPRGPVAQVHAVPEVVMAQAKPTVQTVKAAVEAPAEVREVQTAPVELPGPDASERRDRLRERLKAVRENPRPEPLPETVAEAGVLAVERIAALQTELAKTRAMNLALSQDLEAARRQAERATEEARLRMDEARRLSAEMEGRVQLLSDLEKELSALEGERNEALLALQEARASIEASEREKLELREAVATKDRELESSLQEEERLAGELEAAHEAMTGLRRGADALKSERDTLARQVADLTKERAELLEARKALEAVHRALAKASAVA